MAIYLSNLKGNQPIIVNSAVASGRTLIDSFTSSSFRTAKYHLVVEDITAQRVYNVRLAVTHDSTNAWITEIDVMPLSSFDIDIEAEYDVGANNVELYGTFPNNCKISLERLIFANQEPTLQITGAGGPAEDLYPSGNLYPQA